MTWRCNCSVHVELVTMRSLVRFQPGALSGNDLGQVQRWKWVIFRDPWPMWPISISGLPLTGISSGPNARFEYGLSLHLPCTVVRLLIKTCWWRWFSGRQPVRQTDDVRSASCTPPTVSPSSSRQPTRPGLWVSTGVDDVCPASPKSRIEDVDVVIVVISSARRTSHTSADQLTDTAPTTSTRRPEATAPAPRRSVKWTGTRGSLHVEELTTPLRSRDKHHHPPRTTHSLYRVVQSVNRYKLLSVILTSSSVDRFAKFLLWHIQRYTLSMEIVKNFTVRYLKSGSRLYRLGLLVATLW